MTASAHVGVIGVMGAIGAALRGLFPGSLRRRRGDRLVAVQDAPAEWTEYAGCVSERVRALLDDPAEATQRFHALWAAQRGAADANADARGASLRLKIWLEKRGSIERVEMASPCEPALEAALRTALVSTRMGAPLPRGMRQPIVMQLNVAAANSAGDR